MQKRTEITIETERFLVVSGRREKAILWCHGCDKKVPMLTILEAARTAGATPLAISALAEAGRLHFAVAPEGRLFICPNSLASVKRKKAL
jgi:hypothetical protein